MYIFHWINSSFHINIKYWIAKKVTPSVAFTGSVGCFVVEKWLFSNEIPFVSSGRAGSNPHPIHIHGYTPQVVKVGYPTYNADGTIKSSNPDITCEDGPCQSREAARAFWANDGPLKARKDAPYKDTIIVPTGGYVVLRFKTDNPGWLECPSGIK